LLLFAFVSAAIDALVLMRQPADATMPTLRLFRRFLYDISSAIVIEYLPISMITLKEAAHY